MVSGLSTSTLIKKLSLPNTSYITNTFDSVARLTGTYLKNSSNATNNSHVTFTIPHLSARMKRAPTQHRHIQIRQHRPTEVATVSVATEDRGVCL